MIPKQRELMFADTDKDGFPNPVDCNNRNPNKQGFVGHLVKKGLKRIPGVKRVVSEYETYKSGEPERKRTRHESRMEKLQYRTAEESERLKIQSLRSQQETSRMGLQEKRMRIQEKRSKVLGREIPSVFGGISTPSSGELPSLMGSPRTTPRAKRRKKRK